MTYIKTVPQEEATGTLKEIYDTDLAALGYIPNYSLGMSLRPEAITAWRNLNVGVKSNMDLRRYELVTLAAAMALHSTYCSLAHGTVLSQKVFSPEQVEAIAKDYRNAGLEPAEVRMMEYAEKVTQNAYKVTQEDIDELRACGFSDADILDIALTASARNFFSRLLDAIGARPDDAYLNMEDTLRKTLTVGNPF